MVNKKAKGFEGMKIEALDNIGKTINPVIKPHSVKKIGRPPQHFLPQDHKLTVRIPDETHRLLQFAVYQEQRPMVSIVVDALADYLQKHAADQKKIETKGK